MPVEARAMKTFEESKEEIYSLFQKRCRELLRDFVSEKEKAVCPLCFESCTKIEKTQHALQVLIESLVLEATEGCDNKGDIFISALCPYLSTINLFKNSQGKTAKHLLKEIEEGRDRLLAIIRGGN